jgi:hypothetical protein
MFLVAISSSSSGSSACQSMVVFGDVMTIASVPSPYLRILIAN